MARPGPFDEDAMLAIVDAHMIRRPAFLSLCNQCMAAPLDAVNEATQEAFHLAIGAAIAPVGAALEQHLPRLRPGEGLRFLHQGYALLGEADVMPAIAAQKAQLEAAQAEAVLQHAELGRQRTLRDEGFLSGAALERQQALADATDARVAAAQAALAQARNGLAFQTLRSDRSGIITAIEAEAGSVVAAGQPVVRVAAAGRGELLLAVPERAVNAVREAASMQATLDAVPGSTFALTLRELAPAAGPASRTYAARLALAQPDPAVRWGMSGTVRIALREAPALVVPLSALQTRDATTRVWVVDPARRT